MNKFFLASLFLISTVRSGLPSLIHRIGSFSYHYGIKHLDSQGRATYKEYQNPDSSDLIDNKGEFNFWSNGFLVLKPGELVTFPENVRITFLTEVNTAEWTYNLSTNFLQRETLSQITSISSADSVFICFRIYVSSGKVFAEVTLRKPNRQAVSEKIIEVRKKGKSRMFMLNTYGGVESNWKCKEEEEDFKIDTDNGTSSAFVWRSTRANATCFNKYFPGDVNITYEDCGINYFEAAKIIV